MPQLSIITVNLNNLAGLRKTMESVFAQTFTDYEYIIIDGGSTDGSKEYIEQHVDKLAYWVSEKDGGIYNAMNKGIAKSHGKYLLFLNSGDILATYIVLETVMADDYSQDLIYGNIIQVDEERLEYIYPDKIDFEFMYYGTLPHQATFIKRKLFENVGFYDESYKIVSDWLFYLKALFRFNCTCQHINVTISEFDKKGISNNILFEELHKREKKSVMEQYFASEAVLFEKYKEYRTRYEKIINRFPIKSVLRVKIFISKLSIFSKH